MGQVSPMSVHGGSKLSPPNTAPPTSEDDNMDFEESDDDDDDAKSNISDTGSKTNTSSSGKLDKSDDKRSHHNVLERKRRDLIKDSFAKLKNVVPTLTNERSSRAQILKKAADFIQFTNQKNENFRQDIEDLIKKNSELEKLKKVNSCK